MPVIWLEPLPYVALFNLGLIAFYTPLQVNARVRSLDWPVQVGVTWLAAYWLLDTLRRWLAAAQAEAAQLPVDTLRLRLLKIGGWVREVTDGYGPDLWPRLSSQNPGAAPWNLLARSARIYAWAHE